MRKGLFLSTLSGAALILTFWFVVAVRADDTFQMGITEVPPYDFSVERTLTGTVGSAAHPDDSRLLAMRMMFFTLKTGDKSFMVLIGPKEFVERSGFALNAGASITLISAPALVDGKQILLAREVSANDAKLVVRDERGEPKWTDRERENLINAQFSIPNSHPKGMRLTD